MFIIHSPYEFPLHLFHIMGTFLSLREHPPPSHDEHIAIGCCPVSGCSDWLAQTEIAYNWPIICCMPHTPTQLWNKVEQWTYTEEGDARFVMYICPRTECFLCVVCVTVCRSMSFCDSSGCAAVWRYTTLCLDI